MTISQAKARFFCFLCNRHLPGGNTVRKSGSILQNLVPPIFPLPPLPSYPTAKRARLRDEASLVDLHLEFLDLVKTFIAMRILEYLVTISQSLIKIELRSVLRL